MHYLLKLCILILFTAATISHPTNNKEHDSESPGNVKILNFVLIFLEPDHEMDFSEPLQIGQLEFRLQKSITPVSSKTLQSIPTQSANNIPRRNMCEYVLKNSLTSLLDWAENVKGMGTASVEYKKKLKNHKLAHHKPPNDIGNANPPEIPKANQEPPDSDSCPEANTTQTDNSQSQNSESQPSEAPTKPPDKPPDSSKCSTEPPDGPPQPTPSEDTSKCSSESKPFKQVSSEETWRTSEDPSGDIPVGDSQMDHFKLKKNRKIRPHLFYPLTIEQRRKRSLVYNPIEELDRRMRLHRFYRPRIRRRKKRATAYIPDLKMELMHSTHHNFHSNQFYAPKSDHRRKRNSIYVPAEEMGRIDLTNLPNKIQQSQKIRPQYYPLRIEQRSNVYMPADEIERTDLIKLPLLETGGDLEHLPLLKLDKKTMVYNAFPSRKCGVDFEVNPCVEPRCSHIESDPNSTGEGMVTDHNHKGTRAPASGENEYSPDNRAPASGENEYSPENRAPASGENEYSPDNRAPASGENEYSTDIRNGVVLNVPSRGIITHRKSFSAYSRTRCINKSAKTVATTTEGGGANESDANGKDNDDSNIPEHEDEVEVTESAESQKKGAENARKFKEVADATTTEENASDEMETEFDEENYKCPEHSDDTEAKDDTESQEKTTESAKEVSSAAKENTKELNSADKENANDVSSSARENVKELSSAAKETGKEGNEVSPAGKENAKVSSANTGNMQEVNSQVFENFKRMSAIKSSFFESDFGPDFVNDAPKYMYPSTYAFVTKMMDELNILNTKGYISVIMDGKFSDLTNCSTDSFKILKYMSHKCDISQTTIVVTGLCPKSRNQCKKLPLLAAGARCNAYSAVHELCDIAQVTKSTLNSCESENKPSEPQGEESAPRNQPSDPEDAPGNEPSKPEGAPRNMPTDAISERQLVIPYLNSDNCKPEDDRDGIEYLK